MLMHTLNLLGLAGVGAVAGLTGSLLGLGGGLLTTPLLTLLFGVPIEQAIATSLVAIIGTSSASAGVYVERKLTDLRLGMVLELATTVGAVCGALAAGLLSRRWLTSLFSAFLFYAGSTMVRSAARSVTLRVAAGGSAACEEQTSGYQVRRLRLGMFLSYLAGGISGLLGVGGGPVKVPMMYLVMGVPLKVATATSNLMIGVTAAASAYIYYLNGNIPAFPTAPVVLGVFLGSLLGSRISPRLPTRWILVLFVLVMYYLAVSMAFQAFRMGA